MTTDKANQIFTRLRKQLNKDCDPFMFVHFSSEEGKFLGTDSGWLDADHAQIIIKHLINKFNLKPETIAKIFSDKVISN